MSGASSILTRTNSSRTPNVISSQGLEGGRTRSDLRGGQTTDLCGADRALARPSRSPGKAQDLATLVTSGLCGKSSSWSLALQSCLESRLRVRLDTAGSTLFTLIWKDRVTPLGLRYLERAVSGHHIGDSGYIGWPTPQTHDVTTRGNTKADHHTFPHDLSNAVLLAGWKTPTAGCVGKGGAQDPAKRLEGGHAVDLQDQVRLAGWGTPAARDWKSGDASQETLDRNARPLSEQVQLTAFGETPIGYLLGLNGWEIVPACGQLNAAHSRWLQGFPIEWDVCAAMVTRSRRR